MLCSEVRRLAHVRSEVEQFNTVVFIPLDQFPIAHADAAARTAAGVAVVREVPLDGFVNRFRAAF